jgi:hypothetical protein
MHRAFYSSGFVRGLHICFIQVVATLQPIRGWASPAGVRSLSWTPY